jgi:hypothetical protein
VNRGFFTLDAVLVLAMNYKDVEYAVRASSGRDQLILLISYPRIANASQQEFNGSRDEAIAAARQRIDRWLKSHRRRSVVSSQSP